MWTNWWIKVRDLQYNQQCLGLNDMPASSRKNKRFRVCPPGGDWHLGQIRKDAVQIKRASYPDRTGESEFSEKASWRREHHLKDEEALINIQGGSVSSSKTSWSPRPASTTTWANRVAFLALIFPFLRDGMVRYVRWPYPLLCVRII